MLWHLCSDTAAQSVATRKPERAEGGREGGGSVEGRERGGRGGRGGRGCCPEVKLMNCGHFLRVLASCSLGIAGFRT